MATRHDTRSRARLAVVARNHQPHQLSLPGLAPLIELPFVADIKIGRGRRRRCYWHVPAHNKSRAHRIFTVS